MKTYLLIIVMLFLFLGCAKQELVHSTFQEQESAKKEIKEAVNLVFGNLEKMDADSLFEMYSNSPDFIFFTTDASIFNYQGAKTHNADWFRTLSALKVTPLHEEFRFLNGNAVIYSWQGMFDMTLRTGEQLRINKFGITFAFSKINNRWKIIYQHASSLPPVMKRS